jgi:hypothetical protein
MKRIVTQRRETNGKRTSAYRPVNVMTVETLEEFHKVIEQGRNEDKVVVVRWFATWCKVCAFANQMCLGGWLEILYYSC